VAANKLTTSANAIFLQSTGPLYLLFLGPLLLREKIRTRDLGVFAAVAIGVTLLLAGSGSASPSGPDPRRGNLLGLFSGFAWAWTIAGLRWLGRQTQDPGAGNATVAAGNLLAFAGTLPIALPVVHATLPSLLVLLYLGVFQVSLAYVLLTRSIRHVPAFEASTLLLVEPVFNPVWTWMLWGEKPGVMAVAGGFVIIATAFLSSLRPTNNLRGDS